MLRQFNESSQPWLGNVPLGLYRGESDAKDLNEGDDGDRGEFGDDKPRESHSIDVVEYAQPSR